MSPLDTYRPDLFAGRMILVTGGTSGIGLASARAFRDLGGRVVATGATAAERYRAPAEGREGVRFEVLDVREAGAVAALIGSLDRLDTVVNAAGVIRRDAEHDPETFADVVAVNLTGTMRVCAGARKRLAAAGGAVIKSPPC